MAIAIKLQNPVDSIFSYFISSPFNPSTLTRAAASRSFSSPKNNSSALSSSSRPSSCKKQQKQISDANRYIKYDPEKEPIQAYLRIRPAPENYQSIFQEPYIEVIDNVEVSMTPPENSNAYRTRHRAPERYRFTKVFEDTTSQESFFNETALDLVKDVLDGDNALIFAYGVTNSGKTHTVMGKETDAGILPRSLNMIIKSTEKNKSQTKIKPVMHSLLETYQDEEEENRHILDSCNTQQTLSVDSDIVEIDSKFEYGIWVSFVEVYNEQIFDLLDNSAPKAGKKRVQLPLKYEQKSGNKYVADMNIVKVNSMNEVNAIMAFGQRNRQVFSTLMNQTSSRSHSIFTIHVVKCPIDENNFVIEDPNYATLSKLSIVDLAGSERYRNTNSTGQRLREAGNINKSLMVLGQCMEVLRMNQLKVEIGKHPSIVPFRHSKLTELFKSTFEGDGKAVIIVNVNPFDTGFDENSHVMKFAAVAKDVTTWRQTQPKLDLRQVQQSAKRPRFDAENPCSNYSDGINDEGIDGDDDDDYFVDSLISELEYLNNKWIEAETRAVNAEIDVRAQVSKENDSELRKMEEMYLLALKRESDMMESQISNRLQQVEGTKEINSFGEDEHTFLIKLQEKQETIAGEINALRLRIKESETVKQSMLVKISELEQENQRESQNNEILLAALQKHTGKTISLESIIQSGASSPLSHKDSTVDQNTEDEEDHDLLKENDDPKMDESYNNFLRLRKQLRRSIFKREELCKDADAIMNQVEQFDGVTFKLAKETKMGKLLKLIAQEEFEKDPYQIRDRAIKLFKRYAQLPHESSTTPVTEVRDVLPLPRKELSAMTINSEMEVEELTDLQNLRAENAKLKQRLKLMNEGQHRLKEAFERTRVLHRYHSGEDAYVIDNGATKLNSGTFDSGEQNEAHIEAETSTELSLCHGSPSNRYQSIMNQEDDEEIESDINELLKQKKRHKRRRKLRST